MTRGGMIFLAVLMVNALVSLLYLVWWLIFKKETDNRKQYVMNTVIMLLCPIVGILYFFFAFFKYRFLELGDIDLSDLVADSYSQSISGAGDIRKPMLRK